MEVVVGGVRNRLVTRSNSVKYFYGQYGRLYRSSTIRRYSCLRYKQMTMFMNKQWLQYGHHHRPAPLASCTAAIVVRIPSPRSLSESSCSPLSLPDGLRNSLALHSTSPSLLVPFMCLNGCNNGLQARQLSLSTVKLKVVDGEKSKVEQTVTALKESTAVATAKKVVEVKKSLIQRIVAEILHYIHGFRLLFIDMKISAKLGFRMLRGKTLTRREHQLLIRTVADVFRLVPFSVFVFVPLAELTLPLALKLFPNMLPSTFQTKDEKLNKLKGNLKVKLEVAKFLQDTLDQMSLQSKKGDRGSATAKEFHDFFIKIRTTGAHPNSDDILRFSKLFADDLTLDNLPRGHLMALCRLLELHTIGPNSFLTFQLRMAMRSLKTDDIMIQKEGLDKLTVWELQQALKARGMRAVGLGEDQMKQQMRNWMDLSVNKNIPPTLLLLTRAMSTSEDISDVGQLAETLKQLPESLGTQAEAKLGELEGKVDPKIKIQLLKEEEKKIAEERREEELAQQQAASDPSGALVKKEGITQKDMEIVEGAIQNLAKEKKQLILEKEELQDLKAEMKEYKDDMAELQDVKQQLGKATDLKESTAASRVSKQISKMIKKMDNVIEKAELEAVDIEKRVDTGAAPKEDLVSINELVAAMRKLQKTPDDERMRKIETVLARMDVDQDGKLKVDEVVKVFELLGHEQANITPRQMKEIVEMLNKEEKIEKMLELEDDEETPAKERAQ